MPGLLPLTAIPPEDSLMQLRVHYLPQFVDETALVGSTVIVVDLLRASTTICQALAAGAKCIVPCVAVGETFTKAGEFARSQIVMGGERGGQRIEGFDLGNSPMDYTTDQVFGQTVLFTTTNGTRALAHAHLAERTLVGAAINRRAIVEAVATAERVEILCAGTGGKVTREDILAAGAIASQLDATTGNEFSDAARREWQELLTTAHALKRSASEQFALELRDTFGGKNLLALGYDDDLEFCAQLDALNVVPELDRTTGWISLA